METIRQFLDAKNRLKLFPARRKMKIYCLFYLEQKFDPQTQYTEREVNDLLLCWHTFGDPATLRRELHDYGFLDRSVDGRRYRLAPVQPTLEELIPQRRMNA